MRSGRVADHGPMIALAFALQCYKPFLDAEQAQLHCIQLRCPKQKLPAPIRQWSGSEAHAILCALLAHLCRVASAIPYQVTIFLLAAGRPSTDIQ